MRRIMKPDIKSSDAQSVISDAGTSISGCGSSLSDNREDLQDFAFRLGLPSVDHLTRDRFRVDRRKLESMIMGEENLEPADVFFQNIMDSTGTRIVWPAKLKIGAKSKKDPCIRIAGRAEDVTEAKKKILAILETRPWVINFSSGYKGYRVTMKLDVSYTDHSHIIGKGGQTIKSVMEKTGCHIHFPDSNRINQTEKSNQISIAGDMTGVEKARARVRELTPLIFSFELPLLGGMQPCPEQNCEEIKAVEKMYNVQVMFRTRPKLHSTLVVVKGCEWELSSVKEATLILMNKLCDTLANQMLVHMSMEISPIHHSVVLGRNNTNLKTIMHHTAVQVMFPDANDPNIPSLKKSSVTISGGIHNVYLARQMLLGSLPMVIMFDVTPETTLISNEEVTELMHSLDVIITVRYKPKQSVTSVSIRGVERNANNVYEARRILLKLTDSPIKAVIPESYNIPSPVPTYLYNAGAASSPGINSNVNLFLDNRTNKNKNYLYVNRNIFNSDRKVMPSAFVSQLQSSMWPLIRNIAPQFFSQNQKMQQQEQQAVLQSHHDALSQSSLSLPDIKDCQGAYSMQDLRGNINLHCNRLLPKEKKETSGSESKGQKQNVLPLILQSNESLTKTKAAIINKESNVIIKQESEEIEQLMACKNRISLTEKSVSSLSMKNKIKKEGFALTEVRQAERSNCKTNAELEGMVHITSEKRRRAEVSRIQTRERPYENHELQASMWKRTEVKDNESPEYENAELLVSKWKRTEEKDNESPAYENPELQSSKRKRINEKENESPEYENPELGVFKRKRTQEKQNESPESNENKSFLLSLLSEMRKVPKEKKLKLKLDFMTAIYAAQQKPQPVQYPSYHQEYSSSGYISCNSTMPEDHHYYQQSVNDYL